MNLIVAAITHWTTIYLERTARLLASITRWTRICFSSFLLSAGSRVRPDLLDQTRILVNTAGLFELCRSRGEQDSSIGLKLGAPKPRLSGFIPMDIAALLDGNFGAAIQQMAPYNNSI